MARAYEERREAMNRRKPEVVETKAEPEVEQEDVVVVKPKRKPRKKKTEE